MLLFTATGSSFSSEIQCNSHNLPIAAFSIVALCFKLEQSSGVGWPVGPLRQMPKGSAARSGKMFNSEQGKLYNAHRRELTFKLWIYQKNEAFSRSLPTNLHFLELMSQHQALSYSVCNHTRPHICKSDYVCN